MLLGEPGSARQAVGAVKQMVGRMGRDRLGELGGCRLLQQQRGRALAQRKEREAAEPERERERRAAAEQVVRGRPQQLAREAVADRQQVAMEVHRALGLAGRARGEGDQADVVGRAVERLEDRRLGRDPRLEAVGGSALPEDELLEGRRLGAGALELVLSRRSQSAWLISALAMIFLELARAQQRHRADRDAARLDHREIGRNHHRRVGGAQQHPVAGHEPQVLDQDARDPVGGLEQPPVGPALSA